MRAFLNWYASECEPQGWANPIAKVHPPKLPQELLEPLDLENLRAMLGTCRPRTFYGDRDRAILTALLDTGCRASEFLALSIADVNMLTGAVLIQHGKGNKARVTFLGAKSRRALIAYLRHRGGGQPPKGAIGGEALWVTSQGSRLTYTALRDVPRRRAREAGVPEPTLHSFRRGFAINALRAGVDLVSLQRLLGHSSLAVVSRYLRQVEGDLQAAHQKAGIVDRLLGG